MSVYSLNVEGGGEFSLENIEHDREAPWTNYVRVATVLQENGIRSAAGSMDWCTARSRLAAG